MRNFQATFGSLLTAHSSLQARFLSFSLTLRFLPITGTGSTTYRYYQYQLSVLAVPLTGIVSTTYWYCQYRLPVPAVPISEFFLKRYLGIQNRLSALGKSRHNTPQQGVKNPKQGFGKRKSRLLIFFLEYEYLIQQKGKDSIWQ